jgi:hypothetical protein
LITCSKLFRRDLAGVGHRLKIAFSGQGWFRKERKSGFVEPYSSWMFQGLTPYNLGSLRGDIFEKVASHVLVHMVGLGFQQSPNHKKSLYLTVWA